MSQTIGLADVRIRPAQKSDYPAAAALLVDAQLPTAGVQDHFDHFLTLTHGGKIIGIGGLEIYDDKGLLRSLAIASGYRQAGFGRHLYQAILAKAADLRLRELYLLTETAEGFFEQLGFDIIEREQADAGIKSSIEFREACPASATCMRLRLT